MYASIAVRSLGALAFVAAVLAFCFADSTRVQITTIEPAPIPGSSCQSISKVVKVVDLTQDPMSPVYRLAVGGSGNPRTLVFPPISASSIESFTPLLNPTAPFCATFDSTSSPARTRTLSYDKLFPTYDACATALALPPACKTKFDDANTSPLVADTATIQCNITNGITLNTGPIALSVGYSPPEVPIGRFFNLPGSVPPLSQLGSYQLLPPGAVYPSGCSYDLSLVYDSVLTSCAATLPTSAVPNPPLTVPCTKASLLATKYPTAAIEAAVKAAFTPEYVCAPYLDAPPYLCNTLQRQSGLSIATQSFSLFTSVVAGLFVIVPYLLAYLKPPPPPPSGGTPGESQSAASHGGGDAPGSKPGGAAPPGKLHLAVVP